MLLQIAWQLNQQRHRADLPFVQSLQNTGKPHLNFLQNAMENSDQGFGAHDSKLHNSLRKENCQTFCWASAFRTWAWNTPG